MITLLLYPPFADPTQSYLSLPILKGYLQQYNLTARIADLNIESIYYLMKNEVRDNLIKKLEFKLTQFNKQSSLSLLDKFQYWRIIEGLSKIKDINFQKKEFFQVYHHADDFYNYQHYLTACRLTEVLFECLNAFYFPFQYGFNQARHFILPWSLNLLDQYVKSNQTPLADFYENYFRQNNLELVNLVGISLTFVSQIPETFYLCRFLKILKPDLFIIVGGACIGQMLMNIESDKINGLLQYVDAFCIAEGEETLHALIPAVHELNHGVSPKQRYDLLKNIPNLVFMHRGHIHQGPVKVFDISAGAVPDFSDLDLDRYWAPERILLYAPSRGCYWNKCSFCTYGFNKDGLHRYREQTAEQAVKELIYLSERYQVRHFYLSCDVLSPRFMKQFAHELIKQKAAIKWSCDLKIDPAYSRETCRILHEAGLVSVAFGIESGSDRMLNLMNKGVTANTICRINRNFHQEKIATQWMTFVYHPGERYKDADKTLDLIIEEADFIDLFIVGDFGLTPGSKIAQNPSDYGIRLIYYTKDDDLRLYPLYESTMSNSSVEYKAEIDEKIEAIAENYGLMHYPWAGAISTHHSFLYFCKFGQDIFLDLSDEKRQFNLRNNKSNIEKNKKLKQKIDQLKELESKLLSGYLNQAIRAFTEIQIGKKIIYAPLSQEHFEQFLKKQAST